jgi:hypothetical protein
MITDTGVRRYTGTSFFTSATDIVFTHSESGNNGVVNGSAPHGWGTGDTLDWYIAYEV